MQLIYLTILFKSSATVKDLEKNHNKNDYLENEIPPPDLG